MAYPALISVQRTVSRSALVPFEANKYSVPPAYVGRTVTIQTRVSEPGLQILAGNGERIATHRRMPGSGQTIRSSEHAAHLEKAVLAAFTTGHACRTKANQPPGADALAQLARLRGAEPDPAPQISLADYQELADANMAVSR
jgi:hypothetical protein